MSARPFPRRLLARAVQIREDMRQIFVDAEHWNRLHPEEPRIEADPTGELQAGIDNMTALIESAVMADA